MIFHGLRRKLLQSLHSSIPKLVRYGDYPQWYKKSIELFSLPLPVFSLPDEGHVLDPDKDFDVPLADMHLPFPAMYLEWQNKDRSQVQDDKDMCLGDVLSVQELPEGFLLCVAFLMENIREQELPPTFWAPPHALLLLERSTTVTCAVNATCTTKVKSLPFPSMPKTSLTDFHIQDYANEIAIFAKFLMMVSCNNVRAIKYHKVPEALRKASQRRKQIPHDDYWTLDLLLEQDKSVNESMGGHHASPRLHMRRGHIRRLDETRTTWVRHCMVGSGARIEKNYRIGAHQ